ncbi:MAG: futalosine hydrolase [Ginsengibacter sp.]
MNLLLVAATEFEIAPFLKINSNADTLITGVGIPATIFHLAKKLITNKYDLVIQAGIAGTFNNQLSLSEVVMVKKDTFGDIGIEEKGKLNSIFETGFMDKNEFPYTNGWLVNDNALLEKINLHVVDAITINKIGDNILQNKMASEKFSADIESMEGAAFHYVCMQEKIKFLQLRSISNHVGERDKSKWQLKNAIINLNKELVKITEKI